MEDNKNLITADGEDDDNIWDDTLLIKTYDKSMKLSKSELAKRLATETNSIKNKMNVDVEEMNDEENCHSPNKNSKNVTESYKVGDYIRATYDDGVDYEAKILSIDEAKQTCILKYVGYGNEQEVNISDLVPSWGKKARRMQFTKSHRTKNKNNVTGDGSDDSNIRISKKSKLHHPPPPPIPPILNELSDDSENLSAMLMSWFMSGYYTGLYEGQKMTKNKLKSRRI